MFIFLNKTNNENKFVDGVSKAEILFKDQQNIIFEDMQDASQALFKDNWISVKFDDKLSLSGRSYLLTDFSS
ncbi:hypothetical protein [Fructobacillus ficulneus]|uniref:Uncharacterized protein n=1 Tax=Fructobacillus ficulneus TaxID=157463 RepID=A0A0K8MJ04_9LACO|nr:hypothetical protein [Fructobacillus ficulneus]GAO99864.1 hypothetical protein FFIC_241400 [Fructobacillus ficulneus]